MSSKKWNTEVLEDLIDSGSIPELADGLVNIICVKSKLKKGDTTLYPDEVYVSTSRGLVYCEANLQTVKKGNYEVKYHIASNGLLSPAFLGNGKDLAFGSGASKVLTNHAFVIHPADYRPFEAVVRAGVRLVHGDKWVDAPIPVIVVEAKGK